MNSIAGELRAPGVNFASLVARIVRAPERIEELYQGLASATARVKYGSAKLLWMVSAEAPELLYPRFDFFVSLLDGDNRILRWNATRILANLAAADRQDKLDAVLDKFFAPIRGKELIGAANVIAAAPAIALAKPRLAGRVADEILAVAHANYATPECRNVAIGHAITALDRFFPQVKQRARVLEFAEAQLDNPRSATRAKAARFLKKWTAARQGSRTGKA